MEMQQNIEKMEMQQNINKKIDPQENIEKRTCKKLLTNRNARKNRKKGNARKNSKKLLNKTGFINFLPCPQDFDCFECCPLLLPTHLSIFLTLYSEFFTY